MHMSKILCFAKMFLHVQFSSTVYILKIKRLWSVNQNMLNILINWYEWVKIYFWLTKFCSQSNNKCFCGLDDIRWQVACMAAVTLTKEVVTLPLMFNNGVCHFLFPMMHCFMEEGGITLVQKNVSTPLHQKFHRSSMSLSGSQVQSCVLKCWEKWTEC